MDYKFLVITFILTLSFASVLSVQITLPKEILDQPAFCTECAIVVNNFLKFKNETVAIEAATEICLEFGWGNDVVCEGVVELMAPIIFYVYENFPTITGKDVCSVVFGDNGCESDNPDRIWEVKLPDTPKPPVNEVPYAGPDKPTLKLLHLTDTHYDPEYYPGADTTNCPEKYVCCRESNGIASDPDNGAGFWGDYRNCDIPYWGVAAIYQQISQQHQDIDFIIWTGDIVPHVVWETSREFNLDVIREMTDLISTYFPATPVFPTLGNHEAHPVNQFSQPYITDPEFEMSWLYDELINIWGRWLPSDVATSFAFGGFYSTPIRPGLRIVSVNTNFCENSNFWLLLDSTDIANQLESLAKELQDAEDNGDFVYIIGHIPSGNGDCLSTWSHEFNRVVSRYENTISGIFYGHSHKDHFQLHIDSNSSRAYEVAYIAQSQGTTYNPGYKVYTVEGDFNGSQYRVLDHENWIMDLEATNRLNDTVFMKLYSAKEDYHLPDLSPQSLLNFVFEMNEPNSTLFDEFYRNYVKAGPAQLQEGCDYRCKSNILCRLLTSDSSDHSQCDLL